MAYLPNIWRKNFAILFCARILHVIVSLVLYFLMKLKLYHRLTIFITVLLTINDEEKMASKFLLNFIQPS